MNTKATLITWFAAAAVATSAQAALNYSFTNFAGNPGGIGTADGTGVAARFNFPEGIAADTSGNVYIADTQNHTIRRMTIGGVVTTIAGTPGKISIFDAPTGIAIDSLGNLYVADYGNSTIVKLTPPSSPTGTWTPKVLAGSGVPGKANGTGTSASFSSPFGVAVDALGNVYVADTGNQEIRKITSAGVVTTLISNSISITTNNTIGATNLFFQAPMGIAVDSVGNIYVGDYEYGLIYKFTPGGEIIPGGYGPYDLAIREVNNACGMAVDAYGDIYVASKDYSCITEIYPEGSYYYSEMRGNDNFYMPMGVAVDQNYNIYVADTGDSVIQEIPGDGQDVVVLAGREEDSGDNNGIGTGAKFDEPEGLAIDLSNYVYVADTGNQLIRVITPSGSVSNLAGNGDVGSANGPDDNINSIFDNPAGVVVDSTGDVYVADAGNDRIQKIPLGATIFDITTVASDLNAPTGLAIDNQGDLYVTEGTSPALMISPQGTETDLTFPGGNSLAGIAVISMPNVASNVVYVADQSTDQILKSTNGMPGNSVVETNSASGVGLNAPTGIAVDANGNVYVADRNNNRIVWINSSGFATNIAGTNTLQAGATNGTGTNALFNSPAGVALDGLGNLYVADYNNNSIREITLSSGAVSTIAGGGGNGTTSGSSDGTGTNALFDHPYYIAVNPTNANILYVSDRGNDTVRQLTLSSGTWTVTTLWGVAGYNSPDYAEFNSPSDVAVDSGFNVFVADQGNHEIREISSKGAVTTIAGNLQIGSEDGTNASFYYPQSVSVDVANNVYVADTYNHTIRKITQLSTGVWSVSTLAGKPGYYGNSNGAGSNALFWAPGGVAVDTNLLPNIYVADTYNNTIRLITQTLVTNITATTTNVTVSITVSTIAGAGTAGSVDGAAAKAEFNHPSGIVVYESNGVDTVYVADSYNQTIRMLSLGAGPGVTKGSVAQTWNVVTVAGTPGVIGGGINVGLNGAGPGAEFDYPMGVAVDPLGNVAVADTDNNRITLDSIDGRFEGPDAPSSPGAPGESTVSSIVINTNSGTTIDGLVLVTSGTGTIQHDTWKGLTVGDKYTVKAVAGKNYVFADWEGGTNAASYAVLSDTASYTFTMQAGLVLEAVFVPTPFPAAAGVYNGLFTNATGVTEGTAGMLKGLTVSKTGSYSGTILIDGGSHSIHGSFNGLSQASNEITHVAGGSLPVFMTLAPPLVTGSVGTATLLGELATNQTPADYTMAITGVSSSADGSGAITDKKTVADITGKLSDGTKFSQSVGVAQTGDVPFYASLYGNKGLILGWVNLYSTNVTQPGLTWIKPAAFTNNDSVVITPK